MPGAAGGSAPVGPSDPPKYARPVPEAESQWRCLLTDIEGAVQGHRSRLVSFLCSESFFIIAWYRLNRAGYLRFGRGWRALRYALSPVMPFVRLFVTSEIDYRASIGPGLRILHPQLGIVIGATSVIGSHLILAGGNVIGDANPRLGDRVQMGVGSTVLGPVDVGFAAIVGAGAVVLHDVADHQTVGGIPARPIATSPPPSSRPTEDR